MHAVLLFYFALPAASLRKEKSTSLTSCVYFNRRPWREFKAQVNQHGFTWSAWIRMAGPFRRYTNQSTVRKWTDSQTPSKTRPIPTRTEERNTAAHSCSDRKQFQKETPLSGFRPIYASDAGASVAEDCERQDYSDWKQTNSSVVAGSAWHLHLMRPARLLGWPQHSLWCEVQCSDGKWLMTIDLLEKLHCFLNLQRKHSYLKCSYYSKLFRLLHLMEDASPYRL